MFMVTLLTILYYLSLLVQSYMTFSQPFAVEQKRHHLQSYIAQSAPSKMNRYSRSEWQSWTQAASHRTQHVGIERKAQTEASVNIRLTTKSSMPKPKIEKMSKQQSISTSEKSCSEELP